VTQFGKLEQWMPKTRAEAFSQLRTFITHDLKQILSLERGGNYAVALLIAIGSEALSRLQGLPKKTTFKRLVMPYGLDEYMADDLFDALRPELSHVYETKFIKAGPLEFGIYVGWGAFAHMTIVRDRDPQGLYLNVRTMWADFERILNEAADTLGKDDHPIPADWKRELIENALTESIPGWRRFFEGQQAGGH